MSLNPDEHPFWYDFSKRFTKEEEAAPGRDTQLGKKKKNEMATEMTVLQLPKLTD